MFSLLLSLMCFCNLQTGQSQSVSFVKQCNIRHANARLTGACRGNLTELKIHTQERKKERKASFLQSFPGSEGSPHACRTWWNCKIPYLRGGPMSKVGGVGLLPALCRRRTAWRLNVLRSRRKATASSLACAAAARQT